MTTLDGAFAGDLVVRRVDRVDLFDVLRIERICFFGPRPYSAFEMFVDEPAFLVATRGDEMLGYVVVDVTPNHGNDIGHAKDFAVRLEVCGNGPGRQLLAQSLTAMAVVGVAIVKPEVRVSNDPAIGLYRSLGFRPARRVPSYYGDGEDAYVMVLNAAEWQRV